MEQGSSMDDDKIKIIAHNVCKEYYAEKADSRKQEMRDMAPEILGVAQAIHHEHHITFGEDKRSKLVTKDSANKTVTNLVVTTAIQAIVLGGVVLLGVKFL